MEDEWLLYFCSVDDQPASVFFNNSVVTRLNELPKTLFKLEIQLRMPSTEGLASQREFDDLQKVEHWLTEQIEAEGGTFVGRVTCRSRRRFSYYVDIRKSEAKAIASTLRDEFGYKAKREITKDDDRSGYQKDLYPTTDDWRVIRDLRVLGALRGAGDQPEVERRIDHWAFFQSDEVASAFADWCTKSGYTIVERTIADGDEEDQSHGVRFFHFGPTRIEPFSARSVQLSLKVKALGGRYDGWETRIQKGRT